MRLSQRETNFRINILQENLNFNSFINWHDFRVEAFKFHHLYSYHVFSRYKRWHDVSCVYNPLIQGNKVWEF